ncbi:MAG: hypothetical protein ABW212_08000 [Pseudonocardia sediminis]
MAENFYLDPDGLKNATNGMRTSGREIKAAFDRLGHTLDDHHGCWGTDDIGTAFGNKYVPSASSFRTDGATGAANFTDMADTADEWSETFQSVDEDNARRIDRDSIKG